MPERQTFSEFWYRVADLKPRLIPAVRVRKQMFRRESWHIVQSPINNEYFRLHDAAYAFIALLDGRRTVADAWKIVCDRHGDDAPTQGEAIQLIGQLYQSNLLQADLPPDSDGLFQRYKKRKKREIQSAAMSFLFPKFPLWDPDHFLTRWSGVVDWLFSWIGALLWLVAIGFGLHAITGRWGDLFDQSSGVLSPGNLPFLYLTFAFSKAVHEFAHGFACKCLGRREGDAGRVHVMGIMLLMLTPAPYVDASSSWAFRRKSHRILVASAGVLAELVVASIAAVVWSRSPDGSLAHGLSYNLMFVASVSTLLFNGNPLLRYDAYFILCDVLERPNLGQRSQEYLYYLVKKYVFGIRNAQSFVERWSDRIIFITYGVAAAIYKVFLTSGIILTVAEIAFFLGVLMALGTLVMWVAIPTGKFIRYLFSSPELQRTRTRAVAISLAFVLLVGGFCGAFPFPDRFRVEGVVEPSSQAQVHGVAEGFLVRAVASETAVAEAGEPVAWLENPDLETTWQTLLAREKELEARRRLAEVSEPAQAATFGIQLEALQVEKRRVRRQLDHLTVRAPREGVWVSPDLPRQTGKFFQQGELFGKVVSLEPLTVRAVPGQESIGALLTEVNPEVEWRVKGRPDLAGGGRVRLVLPAGSKELPSPALGHSGGGEMAVDMQDQQGRTSAERFFEIHIDPDAPDGWTLMPGQVIVLRFAADSKPLLAQGWRALLQMFQRRFHI